MLEVPSDDDACFSLRVLFMSIVLMPEDEMQW